LQEANSQEQQKTTLHVRGSRQAAGANKAVPVSRRGTVVSAVEQKERTPRAAKNRLQRFGLGVLRFIRSTV